MVTLQELCAQYLCAREYELERLPRDPAARESSTGNGSPLNHQS